ncbi:MAG: hypothetical protein U0X20_07310 [Caldilineaceae bacterium]
MTSTPPQPTALDDLSEPHGDCQPPEVVFTEATLNRTYQGDMVVVRQDGMLLVTSALTRTLIATCCPARCRVTPSAPPAPAIRYRGPCRRREPGRFDPAGAAGKGGRR